MMQETCRKAIGKWGAGKQLNMIIEECAELQKAISKYIRYEHNGVWRLKAVEELVDVQIMIEQGKQMLTTDEEFNRVMTDKLAKLRSIMEDDNPKRKIGDTK